jgi:hypothetical protein
LDRGRIRGLVDGVQVLRGGASRSGARHLRAGPTRGVRTLRASRGEADPSSSARGPAPSSSDSSSEAPSTSSILRSPVIMCFRPFAPSRNWWGWTAGSA